MTYKRVIGAVALCSMLLAGCGGGGATQSVSSVTQLPNPSPPPAPEPEPEPPVVAPEPEPEPVVEIPPAPTGLTANSGIGIALLFWGNPHAQYQNHRLTRAYRNTVNDFDSATEIGTSTGISYTDTEVEDDTTYWYWIRWESEDGQLGPPASELETMTALDPQNELERITQEILNDPLTKVLLSPIDPVRLVEPPVLSIPAPDIDLDPPVAPPSLDAVHAPVIGIDGKLHVGADVAPGFLPSTAMHGEVSVSHGPVRDGLGANELIAYLSADAASYRHVQYPDGLTSRFGTVPPTVRVVEGTTSEMIAETVRAVQIINAALPRNWQLEFSRDPVPTTGANKPDNGDILIEFTARENWPSSGSSPAGNVVGSASWWPENVSSDGLTPVFQTATAHAWIDSTRVSGHLRMKVLVHEIIHTLGRHHPDPNRFPGSIMNNPVSSYGIPGHILHPLDREALLAVYSRLDPSTPPDSIAEDLGQWEDVSMHVRGDLPGMDAAFGVAWRNGLAQTWAYGPVPDTDLADNPVLFGTASWLGRVLGFTPSVEAVGGTADLSVNLETLGGQLNFTGLESWSANAEPGAVGTGTTWGDGDLGYAIGVRGNTFIQTGGDDGVVTGAFFGASHEVMGGVLERDDLNAAFGGLRD